MTTDKDRIWRAIVEIGTCMMVTRDGDAMRARPMQALPEPDDNAIWFLSDRDTHKDNEIEANPQACLAFADGEEDLYVSLSGTLALIDDREKIAALLATDDEPDEEEEVEATSLIALRFTPEIGEIWDGWSLGEDEEDEDDEEENGDGEEAEQSQHSTKIEFGKARGDGEQ